MLRHHLLITIRSFKRFKSSFFINLIGLSTGLACTLLIFLWVSDELAVDNFHEKSNRLFQVMEHQQYAAEVFTVPSTPGILYEALPEEVPEVEYAVVTTWIDAFTLSIGEKNVKADGYYVSKDFFNVFSYNLYKGDANQVLADKKSIVISKSLSESLFGNDQVVGKTVEFQHEQEYIISGVFDPEGLNSSYNFDFVLSFEEYKEDNEWVTEWGNNGPRTIVTLHENTNVKALNDKIGDFIKGKNEDSNVTMFFQSYADRYLHGRYENSVQSGGRIEYVRLFTIIAVFILIIACINFMNLSTAKASRRIKEVGVKKAVGARQSSLIFQFLSESILMAFASLILAVLVVFIFLPQFNTITDKTIALSLNLHLLGYFIAIALFAGLFAGSYPAFFLSGFNVVKIFKGQIKSSWGEIWARQGLVVFQFTLSVILIVSVLVIYKQIDFVQNKNIGYNKENILHFELVGKADEKRETFLRELKNVPGVVSASSISHSLTGRQNNTSGLSWEGKNPDDKILFENVSVNYGMLETMGVTMKEGRTFSRDFSTDTTKIILNEAAIKIIGFENPIGKVIRLWEEYDMEIIGVVKDFHFQSLHDHVNPLFFRLRPEYAWNAMVRITGNDKENTIKNLTAFYQEFNPGFSFDYKFLDQQYAKQYAAEQRVSTLSRYFAGIAILISCLGLFGLAAFTAERRIKEIGVRKALGSSARNIVFLLTSDFTKLVLGAIFIALPISYYLIDGWLERFAYRIDLEVWFFILSGFIALLIAWLAVGYQAVKAARVNPTQCLRDE